MLSRHLHRIFLKWRTYLPKQRSPTFYRSSADQQSGIDSIFVINLDRQPNRWSDILRELDSILDADGKPLAECAVRYSACDAQADPSELLDNNEVEPFYTLGDQLFVEPQPHAIPDAFDLTRPIKMTKAEIAVASSHIGIWKNIAKSNSSYALVLEDDVWFNRNFARVLDQAWEEMRDADHGSPGFDFLYVSYKEVRFGAPKKQLSENLFCPERGLWYLSGYVLSKKGAQALLDLLPCRGPIDLWINQMFRKLDVRALSCSVVNQRRDLPSTNSYSILPALTRIGILNCGDAALFHQRPIHFPVFVFGSPESGLSSLAMALLMLGYRCCSDFDAIPKSEFESLLSGSTDRVFDAYVNIGSLEPQIQLLTRLYPEAKFIVMDNSAKSLENNNSEIIAALEDADVLHLRSNCVGSWRELCEHLRMAPPNVPYPIVRELGMRRHRQTKRDKADTPSMRLKHDPSPWVAKQSLSWAGISAQMLDEHESSPILHACFEDNFTEIDSAQWLLRNDTFPGNLGLFRPANISVAASGGLTLSVIEEPLGVRNLSAAAITSHASFLFGRFEATFQATNVPGLVSGFFLHRDSPRQEIDIEITGNRPDRLVVNVFYNPGAEGAKLDYGYRGTPVKIPLGFDASKALHKYAIEWDPCEIRWYVDSKLVHRRDIWNPTPIPDLPMTLHFNTWPTRSKEFAGRLANNSLPASSIIRRISVDASLLEALPLVHALAETQGNFISEPLAEA